MPVYSKVTTMGQQPEDNQWVDKWTERVQSEDDTAYHSNGTSIPDRATYDFIRELLPEDVAPLFDEYVKSLLHPDDTSS
jgi:hypothetical protein